MESSGEEREWRDVGGLSWCRKGLDLRGDRGDRRKMIGFGSGVMIGDEGDEAIDEVAEIDEGKQWWHDDDMIEGK